jgi:DNA repair protein RadA/Sms
MAIASSLHNRPIDSRWVVLGEVGLSGELRNVPQVERRLQEASRLGLTRCILPEAARRDVARSPDLELIFAGTVRDALKIVLGPHRVRNQEIPAEANSIETG